MKVRSLAILITIFISTDLFSQNNNWYCWGSNSSGVFGNGSIGASSNLGSPTKMGHLDSFMEVFPGQSHIYAIDKHNILWSWGENALKGQLGINSDKSYFETPQKVETNNTWKTVATQNQFSAGIKSDGTLWVWGRYHAYPNNYGGSNGVDETFPVLIDTSKNWKDVKVGFTHILVLRNDNTLWSLGVNTNGALGIAGNGGFMPSKAKIPQLVMKDIDCFEAYGSSSFSIDKKGYLYIWGQSGGLKITDGRKDYLCDSIYYTIPHLVNNDSNWKCISIKGSHVLALKKNGTLWAWGDNNFGQLGIGNYTNADVPTRIGLDVNWKNISANNSNSFAIKNDGTLWSWGQGSFLGLGFGAKDQNIPCQIGNDSDWLVLNSGSLFSLARKKVVNSASLKIQQINEVTFSPNPTNENIIFNFDLNINYKLLKINIYDVSNRLVDSQLINDKKYFQYPIKSKLGSGLFIICLYTDNQIVLNKKVLVY